MKIANSSYLGFDQLPKLMFTQILTSKEKQLQNKAFIFPSGCRALGQLKRSQFPTEKELSVAVSKEKRTDKFPKSRCSITDGCDAPVGATTTKYPMKKYSIAPLCNTQTHPLQWRGYWKPLHSTHAHTGTGKLHHSSGLHFCFQITQKLNQTSTASSQGRALPHFSRTGAKWLMREEPYILKIRTV